MASAVEEISGDATAKLETCLRILESDAAAITVLAGAPFGGSAGKSASSATGQAGAPGQGQGQDGKSAGQLQFDPSVWRYEREVYPGVRAWSSPMPGTSLRKFTAQGVFLGPGVTPRAVAELLWVPSKRLAWDSSYAGFETVVPAMTGPGVQPTDHVNLCRLMIAPMLVISARDFLSLQIRRPITQPVTSTSTSAAAGTPFFPGCIASVAYSPPADARCPPASGYVRGEILPGSAWLLQPVYEESDGQAPDVVAARKAGPPHSGPSSGPPTASSTQQQPTGSPTEEHNHPYTVPYSPPPGLTLIGVRMTYTIATDIKGWVPYAAVNAAVTDSFGKYWSGMRAWIEAHPGNINP